MQVQVKEVFYVLSLNGKATEQKPDSRDVISATCVHKVSVNSTTVQRERPG